MPHMLNNQMEQGASSKSSTNLTQPNTERLTRHPELMLPRLITIVLDMIFVPYKLQVKELNAN